MDFDISQVDIALRFSAIGTMLLSALLLFRLDHLKASLATIACAGSLIAYLLVSSPFVVGLSVQWDNRLGNVAAFTPCFLIWMLAELILDRREAKRWLIVLAALGGFIALYADQNPLLSISRGILIVGVYLVALYLIVIGDRDDLVQSRRSLRRLVLAGSLILGIGITFVEIVVQDGTVPDYIFPLQAGAFLVVTFAIARSIFDLREDLLTITCRDRADPIVALEPIEKKLSDAIEQEVWRQEGLSIDALARALGTPAHQLRKVINTNLGYRNFSSFINAHRIEAAMEALSDRSQAQRTVLEIAYECGFSSLAPFNKAFREQTGRSPTDFRKASLILES